MHLEQSKSFFLGISCLASVVFLALGFPSAVSADSEDCGNSSATTGKSLGHVFECAHGFKGEVIVKNDREIVFKRMHYDGNGPGAWFHGQLRGSDKSKGVYTSDSDKYMTLPYPNGQCDMLKVGRKYMNEDVTLILPVSITKFQTIGILCYQYCHNFGHIIIPEDLNVPAAPATLLTPAECPKPNFKPCPSTNQGQFKPNCKAG